MLILFSVKFAISNIGKQSPLATNEIRFFDIIVLSMYRFVIGIYAMHSGKKNVKRC